MIFEKIDKKIPLLTKELSFITANIVIDIIVE